MTKNLIILLLNLFLCMSGYSQRLKMTKEEIAEKKCEIVAQYFEFKKYVRVITDRTEIPRIRNSNEIALFRLLSPNFTTEEMGGGNRESFINALRNESNTFELLKRTYETFDCPNFDFVKNSSPSSSDILQEVSDMNIIDPDQKIYTTRYRGSLYYSQIDVQSFNVGSTILTNETIGIEKKPRIKELRYEMFKLSEEKYVLKIRAIKNVNNGGIEMMVERSKKDTTLVKRSIKPKASEFNPCCDQPLPPDSDGDGYNDLVDCSPNDPFINPGATEIIADGIDQNCDGDDQIGQDSDGDGYTIEACKSEDPEIRKLCDCNDFDETVYYRPPSIPSELWYNPYNGWNDDNCDCQLDKKPVFNWDDLNNSDYLIVGKGHLKRGHSNRTIRNGVAILYSSTFLASTGFAIFNKLQSNKFYNKHKSAETIRLSNSSYNKANSHHKLFLISTATAITIFGIQYTHLRIKNKKQKEYYRHVFENEKARGLDSKGKCTYLLKPAIDDNYLGYGLFVNLN